MLKERKRFLFTAMISFLCAMGCFCSCRTKRYAESPSRVFIREIQTRLSIPFFADENPSEKELFASSLLAVDIASVKVDGIKIAPRKSLINLDENPSRIMSLIQSSNTQIIYPGFLFSEMHDDAYDLLEWEGITKKIKKSKRLKYYPSYTETEYFPGKMYLYKIPKKFNNILVEYRIRYPSGKTSALKTIEILNRLESSVLINEKSLVAYKKDIRYYLSEVRLSKLSLPGDYTINEALDYIIGEARKNGLAKDIQIKVLLKKEDKSRKISHVNELYDLGLNDVLHVFCDEEGLSLEFKESEVIVKSK